MADHEREASELFGVPGSTAAGQRSATAKSWRPRRECAWWVNWSMPPFSVIYGSTTTIPHGSRGETAKRHFAQHRKGFACATTPRRSPATRTGVDGFTSDAVTA